MKRRLESIYFSKKSQFLHIVEASFKSIFESLLRHAKIGLTTFKLPDLHCLYTGRTHAFPWQQGDFPHIFNHLREENLFSIKSSCNCLIKHSNSNVNIINKQYHKHNEHYYVKKMISVVIFFFESFEFLNNESIC